MEFEPNKRRFKNFAQVGATGKDGGKDSFRHQFFNEEE